MKISLVIPVKNGADTLRECLEGIFSQEIEGPLEVLAIDSGSTDGSLDILASFPVRVIPIPSWNFSHGDTRNLGAMESSGDLIAFTVQDALPADNRWLARLVQNLVEDEEVAGAFSRIIPRPGCGPLVERGVRGDLNFGSERIERRYQAWSAPEQWDPLTHRVHSNFNDVASAIRRRVWERIPFSRTPFGEDIVWADCALRAGYKIVFDPESVVIHSHEYRPGSIYPRTHIDGWFNRAYFNRTCIEKLTHVFIMTGRHYQEDRAFLRTRKLGAIRRWKESATSLAYHFMEFLGFYMGGRTPGRLEPLAPCGDGPIRVLLASGRDEASDPEGAAAAIGWARTLQERGLEAAFLRGGGDLSGGPAGSETLEGFPLYRVHGGREDDPGLGPPPPSLAEGLENVTASWKPDLLHCLDFGGFTANLAAAAVSQGIPCIVTLVDFWYRCPRGDLVRPDGTYCAVKRPPGMGCAPCLRNQPEYIFPAVLFDRLIRPGLRKAHALKGNSPSNEKPLKHVRLPRSMELIERPERMRALLGAVDFVLVQSLFAKVRCLEAGIDPEKVVYIGPGNPTGLLEGLRAALEGKEAPGGEDLFESGTEETSVRCAGELIVKYRQVLGRHLHRQRIGRRTGSGVGVRT